MKKILNWLRRDLKKNSDDNVKKSGQRFFKFEIKLYGVKTPVVTKLAKTYFKEIKSKSKTEIFALAEALWQSGYLEESIIACNWTYSLKKQFVKSDLKTFATWIDKYVHNWASCDTFCNHSVGELIEQNPELADHLKNWAKSKNLWLRRAAAVSLIVPAKKGLFLSQVFQIADILLTDSEDMVQKGYGWMLKVASQAHRQKVFDYVMKHKANMPRTALRYSIEKMPLELRQQAMSRS